MEIGRIDREKEFHDRWALGASLPDIFSFNEALTSPELRAIHSALPSVKRKKVMDLGCGLGEASVYFAHRGADVTAIDLSPEMLNATGRLAEKNKVSVRCHLAAAEDLGLDGSDKYDVIYVGNLFHHVDIERTLEKLIRHLKSDGVLVSWEPIAYNPVINVYRRIATEVRTPDEHPLYRSDVRKITGKFKDSQLRFFWLSTLVIFLAMALVQRRNPNKVRFWKAVVEESDKWAWLYRPLAAVDRCVLAVFPFLGWLCWNVVIVAKNPLGQEHV